MMKLLNFILICSAFSFVMSPSYSDTANTLSEAPKSRSNLENVLFISNSDGDHEIYLLKKQGHPPVQLTFNDRDDIAASWSPDGRQILFSSMREGNSDIYIMDADGRNQRPLTRHKGLDASPKWSPEGSRITFVSNRDGIENIYILDLKDNRLTKLSDSTAGASSPQWSPDGKMIVYHERQLGAKGVNLILVNLDENTFTNLSGNKKYIDLQFDWSPDSSALVVASRREKMINLYKIDLDSKKTSQLTQTLTANVMPQWSPDGHNILFLSQRDNGVRQELFIMNADGTEQRKLIETENIEYMHPAWSPDGRWFTFTRFENRHFVAYASPINHINMVKISNDTGFQFQPLIAPDKRS